MKKKIIDLLLRRIVCRTMFWIVLLLSCIILTKQATAEDISLSNVFPQNYKFTALLLGNGHFSITTKYIGDTAKQLIYKDRDDNPVKPPNYSSHVHFMVDNVVFQLPYEENPATGVSPPQNPLYITELFRDTVAKNPRINARMYGVMPTTGDTVKFIFTMEPSKRPSGGFIKISATLDSMKTSHNVGVLLLIDTKIGDNDQAPIVTSFGYYNTEREFPSATQPLMPEFWLALEGKPENPGLTARGNLSASGLITPDLFMFGNWTDAAGNVKGLGSFIWKDRQADQTLLYWDSAVLLIWNPKNILPNRRVTLASTEIGIVDSLKVTDAWGRGSGSGGGGGGFGDGMYYASSSGCVSYDTLHQTNCADLTYHPYTPDSLQVMFMITNLKNKTFDNVAIRIESLPAGFSASNMLSPLIPSTIDSGVSAVGTITIYAEPRLLDATYTFPITIIGGTGDTISTDDVCVNLPGILDTARAEDLTFLPLCPSRTDTLWSPLSLKRGISCLAPDSIYIIGNLPDRNYFALANPLPAIIPASGTANLGVIFKPSALGNFTAKVVVRIKQTENFGGGNTIYTFDTLNLSGIGKDEEFAIQNRLDTINFGHICVGDSAFQVKPILNLGGCDVIVQTYEIHGSKPGAFTMANSSDFPIVIPREDQGSVGRMNVKFLPKTSGADTAYIVVTSISTPRRDSVVVVGWGDLPDYSIVVPTPDFDTICPGISNMVQLTLENSTACPVDIDSIYVQSATTGFSCNPESMSITAHSNADISVYADLATEGTYSATVFIKNGTDIRQTQINAVAALRELSTDPPLAFGDVRLKRNSTLNYTVTSTGSAGVEIDNIRFEGINPGDFSYTLPTGKSLPLWLEPDSTLVISVTFSPSDIELRQAFITFDMNGDYICNLPDRVRISGRGIQPVIDIPQNVINVGRVCVGKTVDTSLLVRNPGNAPLHISNVNFDGSTSFSVNETFPQTVDSNNSRRVPLRFTPTLLGDFEARLGFECNGDWLFTTDTLFYIRGTGIICAEVSIDTIYGEVGKTVDIPINIKPAAGCNISAMDIATIMNQSNKRDIEFGVDNDPSLFRFSNNVSGGMVSPLVIMNTASSISISNSTDIELQRSDKLTILKGDVLLGANDESVLHTRVSQFASPYSEILTKDGLLILQWCALDKRYINLSGVSSLIDIKNNPVSETVNFDIYLKDEETVKISLANELGNEETILYEGKLKSGTTPFSADMTSFGSGTYFILLKRAEAVQTQKLLKVD